MPMPVAGRRRARVSDAARCAPTVPSGRAVGPGPGQRPSQVPSASIAAVS